MTTFLNVSNLYSYNTGLKTSAPNETDTISITKSPATETKLTSNLNSLAQGGRYLVSNSNNKNKLTFKGIKIDLTPEQCMQITEKFLKLKKSAVSVCEEMNTKIKKLDILNDEKGLEEVLQELGTDYECLLGVKSPQEHRAMISYLSEKYKALDEKMTDLIMNSDSETVAKASEVFEKAYMPRIMRTQEIMATVDNRPEIKGAYG